MPVHRGNDGRQGRPLTAGYSQKKAARERLQTVRARVADFVKSVLEPGLRSISDELDWPLAEVRQLAHLALPALIQQRRLSLWQAVMRVAREETSDWDSAIASAQRTHNELQRAIATADWDDPLLVEYEQLRSDMEQGRPIKGMPKTQQQTVRAKLGAVSRCHQEIDEKLQILRNMAGVEFFLVITTGDKAVKFAPFISATRKVVDFLPFKFNTSADQFATEMEGFSLFGSEAYRMLASKNRKHKAEVSRLLTDQLRKLTGKPKASLRWTEDSIQANYDSLGVYLIGWPEDITFRPLMFLSNSQARRLHLAIREGAMRFEPKTATTGPTQPASVLTARSTAAPTEQSGRGSRGRRTRQAAPREERQLEPNTGSSASGSASSPARPTPTPRPSTPHLSTTHRPVQVSAPASGSIAAMQPAPPPAPPFIPSVPSFSPHDPSALHRPHEIAPIQHFQMQLSGTSTGTNLQRQTLPPLQSHLLRHSPLPSFATPSSAASQFINIYPSPVPNLPPPPFFVPSQNTGDM